MKSFSKITLATLTLLSTIAVADTPKAPDAKAPPMAMPTPPDELLAAEKMMAGTATCKGTATGMDGKSAPFNGTYKATVELNKFWIHGTFISKMDKATFQFEEYTTYDAASKMWKRVMVMNDGGWMTGAAKMDPTKQEWELSTDGPHGQAMMREHFDMSDMKVGVKMKGEISADKGKTWMPVYDMICKK
jgi:hypothetical protein